jgi:UDP-arabinose 4-epimerase
MTTVLVTGGAGYIGSQTCKALAAAGYSVVTYDSLVYGHEHAVKWGSFVRGDILDRDRLIETMKEHRPSAVLHFAAFAYVGESVSEPEKYYRNNVLGSFTLLSAMRECGIDKIVFSSTCATYGIPDRIPITEDARQHPENPYGSTKFLVERMLADYRSAYGLKSIALRYFNAAGADPDGEIGEDHEPETHLIPLVLQAAGGTRPSITVFGNDYDTPDGTCIRDYVHVADIAEAHILALAKLEQGEHRPAYNLGTERGTSVAEIIAAARKVTGKPISVVMGERRSGDPACLLADSSLARKELGWRPRYRDIEGIIETAWKWTERS